MSFDKDPIPKKISQENAGQPGILGSVLLVSCHILWDLPCLLELAVQWRWLGSPKDWKQEQHWIQGDWSNSPARPAKKTPQNEQARPKKNNIESKESESNNPARPAKKSPQTEQNFLEGKRPRVSCDLSHEDVKESGKSVFLNRALLEEAGVADVNNKDRLEIYFSLVIVKK